MNRRLWTDRDRDGSSTPSELRTLPQAGVRALVVRGRYAGGCRDAHGNDLGLRGSFVRADAATRGPMVDVFFVTRAR
jgi:hypothetical protein